jgi:hypothetical protein
VLIIAETQKTYAMVVGVVLLLVGLLGFFMASPLLGLFGVNAVHNVIHLVSGAAALWLATKGMAKLFNKWFGVVYLLVAVLGFLNVLGFLAVNGADNWLHLVLGGVSLGVAYGVKD